MPTTPLSGAPKVFISSTVSDLTAYRERARGAAVRAGFLPVMNEDWEARDVLPLAECLKRVDGTHLTVVIIAHGYGWVPQDQEGHKSITWLECERTIEAGHHLWCSWWMTKPTGPRDGKERFQLTQAAKSGRYAEIAVLAAEVQRNTAALAEFKAWACGRVRASFASPEELERKLGIQSLRAWLDEHPEFKPQAGEQARSQADPERYLRHLYESCGFIDIRGLHVGSGRAHRFSIEDLYIEIDTAGGGRLRDTLVHPRRIVVGDPGSGKTTFLRWIAHTLAGDRLGITENAAENRLGLSRPLLPVFVSIAEWLEHITSVKDQSHRPYPTTTHDPQWLVHYLTHQSEGRGWGLKADWFEEKLRKGGFLLLFDGLDEAPDRVSRGRATELIEAVARVWEDCPIVVTSRPAAYENRSVLPSFVASQIEVLSDGAVAIFLERWSRALYPNQPAEAEAHRRGIAKRPEFPPQYPPSGPQYRHAHRAGRGALEREAAPGTAGGTLRIHPALAGPFPRTTPSPCRG